MMPAHCIPCTASRDTVPTSALSVTLSADAPVVPDYTFAAPVTPAVPPPAAAPCGCGKRKAVLAVAALVVVYLLARRS